MPATCSHLPRLLDSPASGRKPIWLRGYDSSPGHHCLQGIESAFPPVYSVFNLLFELEYIGELKFCWFWDFVFSFPFQRAAPGSPPHRRILVLGGVSFSIEVITLVLCKIPCVTQWVLESYFRYGCVRMLV